MDGNLTQRDFAEAKNSLASFESDVEVLWILVGGIFVFFMQCGFAMLEAGTVRTKNAINILLKNLIDSCVAALVWWGVGYPLAFGNGPATGKEFIGGSDFFMSEDHNQDDNPEFYAKWFFQWAFAATAATIVSGALAERCKMRAYLMYTIVVTSFVYPIVVHWVWSDQGWLSTSINSKTFDKSIGLIDYAGSSVVHVTGGGAALSAAWKVGPRLGRFESNGQDFENKPNNVGFSMIGTFILWFGWYAFNGASGQCVKDCMATASLVTVNTTLSAATGGTTALILHFVRIKEMKVELAPGLNGILAGLVAITAGCAVVEPYAAIIIGFVGSCGYYGASLMLERMKIDDPLDASPIHFVAGVIGTIAVGFFARREHIARAYEGFNERDFDVGLFYGGHGTQLGVQVLGVLVIAAWTCAINFVLFSVLKHIEWLRASDEDQRAGLDRACHGVDRTPDAGIAAVNPTDAA